MGKPSKKLGSPIDGFNIHSAGSDLIECVDFRVSSGVGGGEMGGIK